MTASPGTSATARTRSDTGTHPSGRGARRRRGSGRPPSAPVPARADWPQNPLVDAAGVAAAVPALGPEQPARDPSPTPGPRRRLGPDRMLGRAVAEFAGAAVASPPRQARTCRT
jgi:hypothetical protein